MKAERQERQKAAGNVSPFGGFGKEFLRDNGGLGLVRFSEFFFCWEIVGMEEGILGMEEGILFTF